MRPLAFILFSVFLTASGCGRAPEAQPFTPSTKAATRSGDIVQFEPNSPQLARIGVAAVESAEVPVEELVSPGKVELNPGRVSRVVLPVAGRVRDVLAALGDPVKRGQPLLTLDSPEMSALQSALRQAEAGVSQARATLAKAEADLARARDLLANRALAQKELLSAETVVAQSKATLEQALAGRDDVARKITLLGPEAGKMDQLIIVRAPIPGKVVEIAVAPGEYRNDTSVPVITVADLSTVWVAADVPESAIRVIRIGEPVDIMLSAFPGRTFNGRVKKIGDLVDRQTRTIKVRAELTNADGQLRPEMFATIRYSRGTTQAIVVPRVALFQQQDRTTVFRERAPGVFEEVTVTVVWQDQRRAAIGTGLRASDRIVVDGITQLRAY